MELVSPSKLSPSIVTSKRSEVGLKATEVSKISEPVSSQLKLLEVSQTACSDAFRNTFTGSVVTVFEILVGVLQVI